MNNVKRACIFSFFILLASIVYSAQTMAALTLTDTGFSLDGDNDGINESTLTNGIFTAYDFDDLSGAFAIGEAGDATDVSLTDADWSILGTGVASLLTVNGLTLTSATDGFTIAGGTTSRTLTVTTANKTLQGAGTIIDLGGNLTLSGANALTFTTTGATTLTLPTTGTLITLAGTEILTNKTLTSPSITTLTVSSGGAAITGNSNVVGTFTINPASTDNIIISPVTQGVNSFAGTITSADLTAAQTWTFPDAGGTITLLGNTTTGTGSIVRATSPALTTPTIGSSGTAINTIISITVAQDFAAPGLPPSCQDSVSLTVTGVAQGDTIIVKPNNFNLAADHLLYANATAADTIIIRECQIAGAATDPDGGVASPTYRVTRIKF